MCCRHGMSMPPGAGGAQGGSRRTGGTDNRGAAGRPVVSRGTSHRRMPSSSHLPVVRRYLGSSLEPPMSEAAWKAEKERIAQRNDEARKAGKKERETQEREREERRRIVEVGRLEAARKIDLK